MAKQGEHGIAWTDATWNPIRGCSRISPGCGGPNHEGGCYAEKIAARFSDPGQPFHGYAKRTPHGGTWTGKLGLVENALMLPLRWKKPRRIFVNSMSDLFHENLPDEEIDRVFAVMALAPQHTFQVLTKRAERMRNYLSDMLAARVRWQPIVYDLQPIDAPEIMGITSPQRNVWLGVSVEDQQRADERIPHLLATPAAKRFISAEPLLGPVDIYNGDPDPRLGGHRATKTFLGDWWEPGDNPKGSSRHGIDWVIVGGESGKDARPMHPDWVRSLRDQCQAADVPFFFKQWGEWAPVPARDDMPGAPRMVRAGDLFITRDGRRQALCDDLSCEFELEGTPLRRVGKKAAGALLDGREWRQFPGSGDKA